MSRSGYMGDLDDLDLEHSDLIQYRGRVASATRGARGQAMLRELLEALDAMPAKELIQDDLVGRETGACCTIGALLVHKEVPDPWKYHEDNEKLADELDVDECLVAEIEYENDEFYRLEGPAERWERMRKWVANQIQEVKA